MNRQPLKLVRLPFRHERVIPKPKFGFIRRNITVHWGCTAYVLGGTRTHTIIIASPSSWCVCRSATSTKWEGLTLPDYYFAVFLRLKPTADNNANAPNPTVVVDSLPVLGNVLPTLVALVAPATLVSVTL